MTIVFRSHTFDRIHSGTGSKISRTRGADWENIRPYQYDDIRDIIWNKATADSLFIRERHDQSGLHILCIIIQSEGDEFYLRSPHESKSEYIKKAEQSIKKASESYKHTYEYRITTSLETIGADLLREKRKGTLILILRGFTGENATYSNIAKLSSTNDIILIEISHPFDKDPNPDILIEGGILGDIGLYSREYRKYIQSVSNELKKKRIDHLPLSTEDEFEKKINYFFKKRGTYGK